MFGHSLLVCCLLVSMAFSLVGWEPAHTRFFFFGFFFVLWGHVAGSRSVCEFRKRREVTSGFLCWDGQVLLSYCEGRKTSSVTALLVNV